MITDPIDAQHKPRSRLTANMKRIQTNSDVTVAKPTRLAIIKTKIKPSTMFEHSAIYWHF